MIETTYAQRTPASAERMARARACMPGGNTRTFGFLRPHPPAFERALGPYMWDLDGNRYVDLVGNGMSLIHGHAYAPVVRAVQDQVARGSAWPGSSAPQLELAELLCDRVATADHVRFVNTGTEATMLAVKLARRVTGRPLVLKALHAYHGSYDDLEAGLLGAPEIPGRTLLAAFGDVEDFARVLAEHGEQVAAVIVEPVMVTGVHTPPPPGFLPAVERLAKEAGALAILDDCIMFRLAVGGSAERFGLAPDLTCLGKWIGGGLPVGAVAGSAELLSILDPGSAAPLYHGGSFNGNVLGCAAGAVAVRDLTAERIAAMERTAGELAEGLRERATRAGVPLRVIHEGSSMGLYVLDDDGMIDFERLALLHCAAMNHGVYFGSGGEVALSTAIDDAVLGFTLDAFEQALGAVAGALRDGAGRR
ncbi:MAG TPA: aminotransferase class III-fold pyridoxal phosphate-dependent enzyme [Conexibacter sp.]|nr:aminotransferase class III-fold pyridoxal phosphate-dependent enzyme [Conexibacter sp.]